MKQFPHIIEKVYREPWLITVEGWSVIDKIVQQHIESKEPLMFEDEETDPPETPDFEMRNGVAIIPIMGTLVKGAGFMEKMCGACSHEDISATIKIAQAQYPRAIGFRIHSPGGTVMGTPELAEQISDIMVPTFALTDGLCCSAAYYLAAATNRIIATPTAKVGCIGVVAEMLDSSKQMEMRGLKVQQFVSGDLKGMGSAGVSLTKAQIEHLQEQADKMGASFRAKMIEFRGEIPAEAMRGQSMSAEEGMTCNLVDELVNDINAYEYSR